MSFFELDGGAKKKAPAKKASGKKAPAKKASGKKSSGKKASGKKKGGNFLGTVSELFAPAGWENFVTAAGLLALDRTDNYLRKNKDSKKQRGGADDDTPKMEEEMKGGARKRSSSRKQRGGSDGHHTVEALDMMTTSGEEEMTSQTGGAKSRRGRKQRGGAMSEEQQNALYKAYSEIPNKNSQTENTYNLFITNFLQSLGVEANPTNVEEAKLVIDYKKTPNGNQSKANAKTRLNDFISSQTSPLAQNKYSLFGNSLRQANTEPITIPEGTPQTVTNNRTLGIMPNNTPRDNAVMPNNTPRGNAVMPSNSSMLSNNSLQFPMSPVGKPANNTPSSSSLGGKPKSKSKSSSKKPKAKKPKTKAKKAPKKK
jgi:hypothetical protein